MKVVECRLRYRSSPHFSDILAGTEQTGRLQGGEPSVGLRKKTMGPKKNGSSKAKKRDRDSTSSDEVRRLICELEL